MEGPGVHLIGDELSPFIGQRITDAAGTTEEPVEQLIDTEIRDVRAVKKRIFIESNGAYLIFHLLLYGSYRVNESLDKDEQLSLVCSEDTLNLYGCSIDVLTDGDPALDEYDRPREDVLSNEFDKQQATNTLEETERMITDVLLDQSVFGGVGNRIKNEVLWEVQVHPTTPAMEVSPETRSEIVEEAIQWADHWYECKLSGTSLNSNAYQKEVCARCETDLEKEKLGSRSRVTYWCPICQQP